MNFRSEVAVCIRRCNCKFHNGFALRFNAAEIFPEVAQVLVILKRVESEGGGGTNQPKTLQNDYDREQCSPIHHVHQFTVLRI